MKGEDERKGRVRREGGEGEKEGVVHLLLNELGGREGGREGAAVSTAFIKPNLIHY